MAQKCLSLPWNTVWGHGGSPGAGPALRLLSCPTAVPARALQMYSGWVLHLVWGCWLYLMGPPQVKAHGAAPHQRGHGQHWGNLGSPWPDITSASWNLLLQSILASAKSTMKLRNDIGSELESSGSWSSVPAACHGIRQEGGYKGISSSVMKTDVHAIKHSTSSRTASWLIRKPRGIHSCLLWGRRACGAREQCGDLTAAAVQGTVGAVHLWLQGCPAGAC